MVGEEDDLGGQGAGESATNQITSISQRLANMPFGGAHEADLMIRVGISPQEFSHRKQIYESSLLEREKVLSDPKSSPAAKHHAHTLHVMTSRTLLVCKSCWLLPCSCICKLMSRQRSSGRVKLWVLMHHSEFGRGTNSGIILQQTLGESCCQILVKGFKPHEAILEQLYSKQQSTNRTVPKVVILFPVEDGSSISCDDVRQCIDQTTDAAAAADDDDPLQIIVIDGTWNGARRMAFKIPKYIPRLRLPPQSINVEHSESLLAPVRRYRGNSKTNGRVSTLEAVAALYRELREPQVVSDTLINNLITKVKAVCFQTGKKKCDNLSKSKPLAIL